MSVELVEPALERALNKAVADVERTLDHLLPKPVDLEARVIEAMRYAIFAGGKRLRPFLVLQTARLFGVGEESALRVAAALEAIHTYSLVHDDLPCMDDDDLRRGQPTVHRKFDEATAVLAGDALLTFAFEVIAHEETHADPRVRCDLVAAIARASGAHGMVGGQMIDLDAEERAVGLDLNGITRLQQLKTGALIAFGCEAGGILGKAAEPARLSLKAYAHDVGLAFQIADDLIDVEGDAALAGKAVGKDAAAGKATFVSILGIDRARQQARMLADQAKAHLDHFDDRADLLRLLADYVVERKS